MNRQAIGVFVGILAVAAYLLLIFSLELGPFYNGTPSFTNMVAGFALILSFVSLVACLAGIYKLVNAKVGTK
jgi:uncharacterized membrane protein